MKHYKISVAQPLVTLFIILAGTLHLYGQSDQHYTMFLYNKLLYNPAYAGSKDIFSGNANYRNQWSGINGAPKTFNISADAPVGSYMRPFRPVAVGGSIAGERIGVESNTNVMAYYAYRIPIENTVLSFGLRGGVKMYSANYSQLNLSQQNDLSLAQDVRNAMLPNVGAGIYWYGPNYYASLSVPNLLQNYYDKRQSMNSKAKEVRGYYASGGYVFTANEVIKLEPQVLMRYAGNRYYRLPFNCDFNLSAIFYDRIMGGITYRTDKSFEFILHVQATRNINVGYAYDHLLSELRGYDRGAHELVIGFDLVRDNSKYIIPRIIRAF
ncbi:MAG: type IX secretion system membrane protein PorP/SprF [Bacteroidota bacterium]